KYACRFQQEPLVRLGQEEVGLMEATVADPHDEIADLDFQDLEVHTLSDLSHRQRTVIRCVLEGQALSQIAEKQGVSRQRIHQIAQRAASKARPRLAAVSSPFRRRVSRRSACRPAVASAAPPTESARCRPPSWW